MLLQHLDVARKGSASFLGDGCTIRPAKRTPAKGKWFKMVPQRKRFFPDAC